jgi:hypothetical protein
MWQINIAESFGTQQHQKEIKKFVISCNLNYHNFFYISEKQFGLF